VAANDTDPDGDLDPASANTDCSACSEPANGTLVNNKDGTFGYMSSQDFKGLDGFVYEICDAGALCDTAAVSITVNPLRSTSYLPFVKVERKCGECWNWTYLDGITKTAKFISWIVYLQTATLLSADWRHAQCWSAPDDGLELITTSAQAYSVSRPSSPL